MTQVKDKGYFEIGTIEVGQLMSSFKKMATVVVVGKNSQWKLAEGLSEEDKQSMEVRLDTVQATIRKMNERGDVFQEYTGAGYLAGEYPVGMLGALRAALPAVGLSENTLSRVCPMETESDMF